MAFGTLGSTLNDELNRLANGGTYRDMDDMVDEALAAKQWANRENIIPYSTDTVGILNEIAALGPNRQNWFDFNGVCNYLAGTTGLPAAAALRQITTTGDILTSLASYYVDAATPRYNYPGYIYLNGTAQFLSTPDSAALDITGDIDLRVQVALDSWVPSVSNVLISKEQTTTTRSFRFYASTGGKLGLAWFTDGITGNQVESSVVHSIANGTTKWVRVTLDVNNGASGNDVKFYTSDNGTTWTQLGTTVTTAGVTSIYSGTSQVEIGSRLAGANDLATGKFYNAQMYASLDGTDKRLDVDLTTNVTSATLNQFTATTGQLVTINGQDVLTNGGTAGSLLPTTVGSSLAADSNDPKFLDHTGTNYVYLPNVASNYMAVPYSSAFNSDDLDIQVNVALDDWTPAGNQRLVGLWSSSTGNNRGWLLDIQTNGTLFLSISPDGIANNTSISTASVSFADGQAGWVRATYRKSDRRVQFFTSNDGNTWTQLGTDLTNASTSIFATNSEFFIGWTGGGGSYMAGKVLKARLFNGIGGTKVLDVDTSVITSGADTYVVPTTYTGQAGAYFTGTGLSLNGVAGNFATTPDSTQIDITGDIDVQVKVAMADWTPAANQYLFAKSSAGQDAYALVLTTNGRLDFYWVNAATTATTKTSSVAVPFADGATGWVRATLDVNNGASGNDVIFYTSTDGTTWTQLGTTQTTAGVTDVRATTAPLNIGTYRGTANEANGTFYRTIIKSGIDGFTVFDADFTQVPANALRMTESSTNRAVVTLNTTRYATINRSTSGRKSVAVTQPTWLFGTDDYMEVNNRYMAHSTAAENYVYLSGASGNYMSVADNPPLDITGDIDIQCKVALDDWTPAAEMGLISKQGGTTTRSYRLSVTTAGRLQFLWSADGTIFAAPTSTVSPTVTDGATLWVRVAFDVDNGAGGNTATFYTSNDGVTWTILGTPVVTAGIASLFSSTSNVEIGSWTSGASGPARGKFFRSIIKNGIDGTVVLDADASVITLPSQTTFVDRSSNAYTVTINKSGVGTFVSTGNYLYLPGIASNCATAPDAAALDVTGDIDLRAKVALDAWSTGLRQSLINKAVFSNNTIAYALWISETGLIQIQWSPDGTSANSVGLSSTVATGLAAGTTKWVRATLDVDNGAAGKTATFFTSDDGITWTQLGTAVTTAGTTSIANTAAVLEVGSGNFLGNWNVRGKFFRAQVLNGINGTVAFDANFESSITSLNQASFTESSTNGATVTINRSGSTYRSAGVIDAGYLYPGATNTFSNSTTDFLNFGATDSFTVLAVARRWNTQAANILIYKKFNDVAANPGYGLLATTTDRVVGYASDGTNQPAPINSTYTSGPLFVSQEVRNVATDTVVAGTQNGTNSTADTTTGSLTNIQPLRIGATPGGAYFADMEFMAGAVFRSALSTAQIRQVTNYFINREAYL